MSDNPRRLYRYCPGTDHPMAPNYCAATPHDACDGCASPLLPAESASFREEENMGIKYTDAEAPRAIEEEIRLLDVFEAAARQVEYDGEHLDYARGARDALRWMAGDDVESPARLLNQRVFPQHRTLDSYLKQEFPGLHHEGKALRPKLDWFDKLKLFLRKKSDR